jgi:hypothetical protein
MGAGRRALVAPAPQQRPGAARAQGAQVGATVTFPGDGAASPRRTAPLAALASVAALRRPATETAGGPGEARKRRAGAAGPVAWPAAAAAPAAAARRALLSGTSRAPSVLPRPSAWAVVRGASLAAASIAAACAAAHATDEAFQLIEAAGKVCRVIAVAVSAFATRGHRGVARPLVALRRVVRSEAAGRRLEAQQDPGVRTLLPAAPVPRRFTAALRRGDAASTRNAEAARLRMQRGAAPQRAPQVVGCRMAAALWALAAEARCAGAMAARRRATRSGRAPVRPLHPRPPRDGQTRTQAQMRLPQPTRKRPLAGARTLMMMMMMMMTMMM